VLGLLFGVPAKALDKQGSAHGGRLASDDTGIDITGSTLLGFAAYNPDYAARPDNSGRVLVRFAQHFDVDLIGQRLFVPIDINVFTDRSRPGIKRLLPSEMDLISGLAFAFPASDATAIEGGIRAERDMPIDRTGFVQQYVDLRLRLLYSLDNAWKELSPALASGNISGCFTLGWFVVNPSYAARPDNSGRALFRYGYYGEISTLKRHLALGLSTTLFTDKRSTWVVPTELDITPELIARANAFEFHLSYERDMPLDRSTLVQSLVLAHLQWNFTLYDSDATSNR
jgi:hypothetical protein